MGSKVIDGKNENLKIEPHLKDDFDHRKWQVVSRRLIVE